MQILMIPAGEITRKNKLSKKDTLIRCQHGLSLLRYDPNITFSKVVLSGGIFNSKDIQTIPASQIMANWLTKYGVLVNNQIIENQSRDTFENVLFTIEKLKEEGIENPEITVVTQWQHAIRFRLCFKAYGIKIQTHSLHYSVSLKTWIKEWLFIAYHIYDRKGTKFFARRNRKNRTY